MSINSAALNITPAHTLMENPVSIQPALPSLPEEAQTQNEVFPIWLGRKIIFSIGRSFGEVLTVFNNSIKIVAKAFDDSYTLSVICRKLDQHILAMLQQLGSIPSSYFMKFSEALKSVRGVVEVAQIAVDINYFVSGKFRNETMAGVYGKCCLAVSNLAYGLNWLKEIGAIKLNNVAASLGNVKLFKFVPAIVSIVPGVQHLPRVEKSALMIGELRVFSFVNKVALDVFAETALAFSYLLFAYRAYENYHQATEAKNDAGVNAALLDGMYFASELAIEGFLVVGCSNAIVLGSMAATSVLLAIISVGYRNIFAVAQKPHSTQKAV